MGRLCVCMYVCVFVSASAPTASVRPAAQSGGTTVCGDDFCVFVFGGEREDGDVGLWVWV